MCVCVYIYIYIYLFINRPANTLFGYYWKKLPQVTQSSTDYEQEGKFSIAKGAVNFALPVQYLN